MEGWMEAVLSPGPAVCVKVYVWIGRESGEENLAAEIQGIHEGVGKYMGRRAG